VFPSKIGAKMRFHCLVFTVLFILLISLTALSVELQYENSFLFTGSPRCFQLHDGYLFALGNSALEVFDISNLNDPELAGGFPFPWNPSDLSIYGNYAFVAVNHRGIFVLDITNAVTPRFVTYCQDYPDIQSIVAVGSYAYISAESTFCILDISNPQTITLQGQLYMPEHLAAVQLCVKDYRAYVCGDSASLYIIDISNLSNPTLIGNIPTSNYVCQLYADDQFLYFTDYYMDDNWYEYGNFNIYDISNPETPINISQYNFPYFAGSFDIDSNLAYVTDDLPGIEVLNIADRSHPILMNGLTLLNGAYDIKIAGDLSFISANGALRIADISNPDSIDTLGYYSQLSYHMTIDIMGDYAYVAGSLTDGFEIVSLADLYNLRRISSIELISGSRMQIAVAPGYACVSSNWQDCAIVDISDPSNPFETRRVSNLSGSGGVCVSGNYAYLPCSWDMLSIFCLSDPSFNHEIQTPGTPLRGCVVGDFLYLADGGYWLVLSISNPAHVLIAARYHVSGSAHSITVIGNYAFIAMSSAGISIWDITDPIHAHILGTCVDLGYVTDIVGIGNFVFTNGDEQLQAVDVSDPANPSLDTTYNIGDIVEDLCIKDSLLYVVTTSSLQIFRIVNPTGIIEPNHLPTPFSLSQNYPNPFNSSTAIRYSLPAQSKADLVILDILGRAVRHFEISAKNHEIIWDGNNSNGLSVASGIYFYTISGRPETARKMILLR
jgi:hypothetical protein